LKIRTIFASLQSTSKAPSLRDFVNIIVSGMHKTAAASFNTLGNTSCGPAALSDYYTRKH